MAMRPPPDRIDWQRLVGAAIIGAGVLGLLLSLAGLVFVLYAGATAEAAFNRELDTIERALSATADGLAVADSALADARVTLGTLSSTVDGATSAITETQPTLASLQDLTGESLPATISSTRQALASAQETARVIDGVLSTAAIFGVRYNPEVPLNEAIGEVSESLAPVPASLDEVSRGLSTASSNLTEVSSNLTEVARGIEAIAASVSESAAVIDQYQAIVRDLRNEVAAVREAAPSWFLTARIGLTLLMIWLGLAQLGLLTQGWELIGGMERGRPGRPG